MTKYKNLWVHLGASFILLFISLGIFLAFPKGFPHPEDFSPYAYLAAFLLSLLAILRMGKSSRRAIYFAIAGLCLLLLLEEISFGVEWKLFQPIYWEKYDVQIYDLHNLIPASIRILGSKLGIHHWDRDILLDYFRNDLAIILSGIIFSFLFAIMRNRLDLEKRQRLFISSAAIISTMLSISFVSKLLALPVDPNNATLAGFSIERLGAITLISVVGVIAFAVSLVLVTGRWQKELFRSLNNSKFFAWLKSHAAKLSILVIGLGIIFQMAAGINPNAQRVILLDRINPILYWALANASLIWFVSLFGNEAEYKKMLNKIANLKEFSEMHPAIIYAFFTIFIVGFAQLIDKDFISLDAYLNFPQFWVSNWSLYIEEVFEAVGGILLSFSTLFFPRN